MSQTKEKTIRYTEIFYSPQGEGEHTGKMTAWVRLFSCNLECRGFGQPDPADPKTYHPVGNELDLSDITSLEQLQVFPVGCDSAYSVAKRFRHLAHQATASEIAQQLVDLIPNNSWTNQPTGNDIHLAFTGGEPMMQQRAIADIIDALISLGQCPLNVTIETNGTMPTTDQIRHAVRAIESRGGSWFWSLSPKLHNTAGEPTEKAIKPDVVHEYQKLSDKGQLKFVVNGSKASWDELDSTLIKFRQNDVLFSAWVMGVGGTIENLRLTEADIAVEAIKRGYHYSSRVHAHLFGNELGT